MTQRFTRPRLSFSANNRAISKSWSFRSDFLFDSRLDIDQQWVSTPTDAVSRADLRKRTAKRFLVSNGFDMIVSCVIVCQTIIIGAEVQHSASGSAPSAFYHVSTYCFNIFYIVELIMRLWAEKWAFIFGKARMWNLLDILLVVLAALDMLMASNTSVPFSRGFRMIRALRVVRVVRIGRACQHFREFYKMVFSIGSALRTLFWALVVLFLIIYTFAVTITQGVVDARGEPGLLGEVERQLLGEWYGGLWRSCYSLYKAISGGQNWGELVTPLGATGWFLPCIFLCYVTLSILGVLNVLTSIFIDAAMSTTSRYRELAVTETQAQKQESAMKLRSLFSEIDTDNSGTITQPEFEAFMQAEESVFYVASLGITPAKASVLFRLLDAHGTGEVDADEFFNGLTRMQGEAKNFDIQCMMFENRMALRRLVRFVQEQFHALRDASPKATTVI